jgi:phosphopantetheine adenylyltransferase
MNDYDIKYMNKKTKAKVVVVSGGFDPVHIGHGGKVQSSSWLLQKWNGNKS